MPTTGSQARRCPRGRVNRVNRTSLAAAGILVFGLAIGLQQPGTNAKTMEPLLIAAAKTARYTEKEGFERAKKDILNTLKDNTTNRFTSLLEAMKDAFHMDTMLQEKGPYTIFAPSDNAFRHFPADDWARIYANKPQLKQVLLYHMVPGAVDSNALRGMKTLKTLDGREVAITTSGGNLYIDKTLVITTDIPCTNGVIHILDRVNVPAPQ